MRSISFVFLSVLMCPGILPCQTIGAQSIKQSDPSNSESGTVYRLQLSPAAQMQPAFKHRFSVEPHKTIPGNAITHYLRSYGENSFSAPLKAVQDQFGQESHAWYDLQTDVSGIPVEDLRTAAMYFDGYVENYLKRATLCRNCDWGYAIEDLQGPETIEFLLPSVQQTRSISRALAMRHRLAIIDGRFDDAVANLRMNFMLGQNVGKLDLIVADLVAIAISSIAQECVVDFINAENSPNLYWALAELPDPVISIRDSLRLEASLAERYFPELQDIESAEYSDDRWNEILVNVLNSTLRANQMLYTEEPSDQLKSLNATGLSLIAYGGAKERLLESGISKEQVNQMAVGQVILLDIARDLRMISDELQKQFYVPPGSIPGFENKLAELELRPAGLSDRMGVWLGGMFAPAVAQAQAAELRCQARTNLLMAIESIRHHLDANGSFPNSLHKLELPVRNNPFTGQPFPYELQGKVAVIEIPRSPLNDYPQRFELSIR